MTMTDKTRAARRLATRQGLKCAHCDAEFEAVRNTRQKFCSAKCRTSGNYENNKLRARAQFLERTFALPMEVYDYVVAKQSFLCALCGEPETSPRAKRLAVDHDHSTGIVRGFLCGLCNRALGNMRDNPALLRKAADYLDAHNRHTLYSAQIAKRLQIPTT
jgi:Recombination endonuclease VII